MLTVKVDNVTFDDSSQMGIILLSAQNRVLPIWIGIFEAQSILLRIQETSFPRPLTHDLLKNSIEQMGGSLEYVFLNEILNGTYYAQIHLQKDGQKMTLDCRPSDAIALAIRSGIPIYVDEKIFESCSVDKEDFLKQQKDRLYKAYLESLGDDEIGKLKH